jgi:hypothetical protein
MIGHALGSSRIPAIGEDGSRSPTTVGIPFFVDDGTGRMLIDPQGARLDVHRNFKEAYGGSFLASRDLVPDSVRKFLLRHGIWPSGRIRLEEHCITPGYPVYVFDTPGENPVKSPGPLASRASVPPTSSDTPANPI